jgi:predicted MFS family arabinose efflux permease
MGLLDTINASALEIAFPQLKLVGPAIMGTNIAFMLIFFIISIIMLTASSKSKSGIATTFSVFVFLLVLGLPIMKLLSKQYGIKGFTIYYTIFTLIVLISMIILSNTKRPKLDEQKQVKTAKNSSIAMFVFVILYAIIFSMLWFSRKDMRRYLRTKLF